MPEFLTTRGTTYHLEQLIQSAERRLTLISPYLQFSNNVLARLKAADSRGVETHLVYRTEKLSTEERAKLQGLKKVFLYTLDNLHAKCYANERQVLISSMNLYDYSETHNWEMGVLLSSQDSQAIADARKEIDAILQAATAEPVRGSLRSFVASAFRAATVPETPPRPAPKARPTPALKTKPASAVHAGYCIRCSDEIRYRPQSPLCDSCYSSWATWGNESYPEKVCHRCARPADVSKSKPLCAPCFRAAPFSVRGPL